MAETDLSAHVPLNTVARIMRIDDSYSISMGLNGLCLIYVVEHQWHQTWAPPPLRTVRMYTVRSAISDSKIWYLHYVLLSLKGLKRAI